jgi:RNA polymerase-interacting CarD/CdnL/TRCF family regulator
VAKQSPAYSIGDMVVHRYYGIGKIESIDNKPFDGVKVDCFKVSTDNCVYWFPKDSLDNPRVHLVASPEMIEEAVEILQSAPEDIENDPIQWKERIDDVVADGSIIAISTLVRDLNALKMQKNLNRTQDQALSSLKDRLLREWAASMEVDANSIRPTLQAYLNKSNSYLQNTA